MGRGWEDEQRNLVLAEGAVSTTLEALIHVNCGTRSVGRSLSLPILFHGRQRWEGRRIWVLWLVYLPQSSGSSMLVWGHSNIIFTKDKLLRHPSWSGPCAFSVSDKGNSKMETFCMWPKPDTAIKIWHLNVCVVKCYRRKGLVYTASCLIVLNMIWPWKTASVLAEHNPNMPGESTMKYSPSEKLIFLFVAFFPTFRKYHMRRN